MYRKIEQSSTPPENFEFPFEGKLLPENRWVIMADLIPWNEFEEEYAKLFSAEKGAPADIKYPTDLGILNQARILTERIIDNLYKPLRGKLTKRQGNL
jgi:hypothetical protein